MFKYFSILFVCIILISCGEDAKQKDTSDVQGALSGGLSSIAIPTYFNLTEKSYAKEVEIQIKNLEQSATNFYQQNGRMPGDCYEEMEQAGAIEMKQSVIDAWEFQCDWLFDDDEREISGTVTATSTEQNEAGAGKTVVYDLKTGEITGYGQGEQE